MTTATERHRKQLKQHHFRRVMHLNMEDCGIINDRCEALKLTRIVRTPKTKGRWGLGVVTFAVDGVDEEFDTIEAAVQCLENLGILKADDK